MKPFLKLKGVAAPLPFANVDTDKIVPARFLKTITKTGLGAALFDTLRFDENGAEQPDFILNREPWRCASVLVAFENFGCGSSREHAPWALADFGIRCIIAPSFADIFYNNCFKSGILPIVLSHVEVERLNVLVSQPASAELLVDLESMTIEDCERNTLSFFMPLERRNALLRGVDDIFRTLRFESAIGSYERRMLTALNPVPCISQF